MYHSLLLMTATSPKYECSVCEKAIIEYENIANIYTQQNMYYLKQIISSIKDMAFANNYTITYPIEFKYSMLLCFVIDIDFGSNSFYKMGLDTAPHLFLIPSSVNNSNKSKDKSNRHPTSTIQKLLYESIELDPYLLLKEYRNHLSTFIKEHTGGEEDGIDVSCPLNMCD